MSRRAWARAAVLALWLPVVAYAVLVSRDFFRFADSAVYVSTDDGMANISYALGAEGRYGFLSSPVLTGMARDQGLFSYGPFYFYVGAALIWMFGYNLTLLRFIHLGVILAIAAAGRAWFGRTAAGAAGAFTAVGLLTAFERAQWPMVRPDSMVSLFAVTLAVCAGLAIRNGKSRYWFAAGLAGAAGAFSHLIAWSLLPAVVAILAIGYLINARADDGRWSMPTPFWSPLLATALGGATGALLFYASFDFRFRDQWRFLTDYQQYTGSMGGASSPGFASLVLGHFNQAYWYLPDPLAYLVWATMAAAVIAVAVLLAFDRGERRRRALAFVAPPTIVWVGYLLSLGKYNNFHAGYAILNQVMWLWTGGSLLAALLDWLRSRPALRKIGVGLAWMAACVLSVGMLTWLAPATHHRALAAAAFVPFGEYAGRVVGALPARARAWGSVEFGIEHPHRIQLIQFWDAIRIVEAAGPAVRASLAPDFLVWGRAENGANAGETLTAADRIRAGVPTREIWVGPRRLDAVFPSLRYTLLSMVGGPPYGVTRVYGPALAGAVPGQPTIDIYDPKSRQWNSVSAPAVAVPLTPAPQATLRAGGHGRPSSRTAVLTLQGEMGPGVYLLRVPVYANLSPGQPVVVLASASTEIQADVTAANPDIDVAPWFAGEPAVHLIYTHPGGSFYVSQFGDGPGGLSGVEAAPIVALTGSSKVRGAAAPAQVVRASDWIPSLPVVKLDAEGADRVSMLGDATQFGYQAYAPPIQVPPGQRMRIRVPVTVTAGRVCLGVLDGTEQGWLVVPDRLLPEYEFDVNDNRTVKLVLANCNGSPDNSVAVRATIGDGSYTLWSDREESYVDQLMREFRNAGPRQP